MWGDPIGAAVFNHPHLSSLLSAGGHTTTNNQSTSSTHRNIITTDDNNNDTNHIHLDYSSLLKEINTEAARSCHALLLQITGPAHIPYQDSRWSEFYKQYNILVHLDHHDLSTSAATATIVGSNLTPMSSILGQSVKSMSKHAGTSSNLACLGLHLSHMLSDLCKSCHLILVEQQEQNISGGRTANMTNSFTDRITLVGKARVTCGLLNLFRILVHDLILTITQQQQQLQQGQEEMEYNNYSNGYDDLKDLLTYKPRHGMKSSTKPATTPATTTTMNNSSAATTTSKSSLSSRTTTTTSTNTHNRIIRHNVNVSKSLLSSLLSFISVMGGNIPHDYNNTSYNQKVQSNAHNSTNSHHDNSLPQESTTTATTANNMNTTPSKSKINSEYYEMEARKLLTSIPELYDTVVFSLNLLLVLCSSQLYQPMNSSFQIFDMQLAQQQQQQQQGNPAKVQQSASTNSTNSSINRQNYFLDLIFQLALEQKQQQQQQQYSNPRNEQKLYQWSSQTILSTILNWFITYPTAPPRSIAYHNIELANSVANDVKDEKIAKDGLYENYSIVISRKSKLLPQSQHHYHSQQQLQQQQQSVYHSSNTLLDPKEMEHHRQLTTNTMSSSSNFTTQASTTKILNATSKVIHMSSSLLLLPFRLMNIALRIIIQNKSLLLRGRLSGRNSTSTSGTNYDYFKLIQLQSTYGQGIFRDSSSLANTSVVPSSATSGIQGLDRTSNDLQNTATCCMTGSNGIVKSFTNDVLWLTNSPIADLGCALFLLLVNNYRASILTLPPSSSSSPANLISNPKQKLHDNVMQYYSNPFRSDLESLDDNRWDSMNAQDLELLSHHKDPNHFGDLLIVDDDTSNHHGKQSGSKRTNVSDLDTITIEHQKLKSKSMVINFENLFEAFGSCLHNEVGTLMLYTLLQSSPILPASLAVRSDLEILINPLLRTLYFASSVTHHISGRTTIATNTSSTSKGSKTQVDVLQRPFRSQSQLYVTLILLLIFSQDTSFGPDSFRRTSISEVPWYKERNLKDINLGSLLILCLLRCITFNLNRMEDAFLLSNCCAVLLNLSPHMGNIHPYAAMRLVSVAVSSMKRYLAMVKKNSGKQPEESDLGSIYGMYAEVTRTLLQILRHTIRRRVIHNNLHIVYELVYLQRDFQAFAQSKYCPFNQSDMERILSTISQSDDIIRKASARTAGDAMVALLNSVDLLKSGNSTSGKNRRDRTYVISSTDSISSEISTTSTSLTGGTDDFTFTYEEESDPEIFFVPYVWDIIVSVITAGALEWRKEYIQVFPLLASFVCDDDDSGSAHLEQESSSSRNFANDVADVV